MHTGVHVKHRRDVGALPLSLLCISAQCFGDPPPEMLCNPLANTPRPGTVTCTGGVLVLTYEIF